MNSHRIWMLVVLLMSLVATLVVALAGCGVPDWNVIVVYDCDYPIVGRRSPDGKSGDACCHDVPCPCHCLNDPCPGLPIAADLLCELAIDADAEAPIDAGTDAPIIDGGTSSCSGSCVVTPPYGDWEGPGLLWLGPEGSAPACPTQAPTVAYQGHDGLNAPLASCGTCSCSASSGSCAPPLSFTTSSKPCGDSAGMTTPFNGPPAWDGSCTAKDCISPDPICAHSIGVQSLTVAPLMMKEQGCTPSIMIAQDSSAPAWSMAVLACRGPTTSGPGCSDMHTTCVPFVVPPEFAVCIYQNSDVSCPDTYPEKHLVYADFDDHRACSACACSVPLGSSCKATLDIFQDETCTVPLLSHPVGSGPSCFDLMPADPSLGSKTVTALAYKPGNCLPSGGEASGTVEPSGPSTFCCLGS